MRSKSRTVPNADAQRWKLELEGTSELNTRDAEAAVEDAGWTHLQTRTEHAKGVTRVYFATELNTAPESIASELGQRMSYRPRMNLARLDPPTTWEAIRDTLERTADGRDSFTRARAVVPTA